MAPLFFCFGFIFTIPFFCSLYYCLYLGCLPSSKSIPKEVSTEDTLFCHPPNSLFHFIAPSLTFTNTSFTNIFTHLLIVHTMLMCSFSFIPSLTNLHCLHRHLHHIFQNFIALTLPCTASYS